MFFKKRSMQEEETSYWMSFSDLMASVLIIFILLFVYNLVAYRESLDETQKTIEELTSTRMKIITMLQEEFEKENMDIVIDPKTGAIQLNESILFDVDKSELKEEGKEFSKRFIPVYVDILLGNEEIRSQISQIIIEGHTDYAGGYLYNLELSQERSLSVAKFLLSPELEYNHKNELENYLTINGRSYSEPIKDENGNIDKNASRRVEIKFRLKEEEVLLQIQKELEKGTKE